MKKAVEPARGAHRLTVEGEGRIAMATADVDAIVRRFAGLGLCLIWK